MTHVQVYVAVGAKDEPAGTLYPHRRRGVESATFTYASGYLASQRAYAIDPELPLASGARQTRIGNALFGSLTDCAPDRWGRTLLTRREAALAGAEGRTARSLGEIDYVLGVRDDLRDDHLRNHGFLHDRGDVWRLSPAFDLNPDPAPGPKYLSTAIDDAASLTAALAVAEYFRLSPAQAREALHDIASAVRSWRTTAAQHRLTPPKIAAGAGVHRPGRRRRHLAAVGPRSRWWLRSSGWTGSTT